jgi:hypothetical protein
MGKHPMCTASRDQLLRKGKLSNRPLRDPADLRARHFSRDAIGELPGS